MKTNTSKNWNDRIWQREFLVKELTSKLILKGRHILDIGCGEGQNFSFMLSKYCDENSLYIGTDISFSALELNRSRNAHKNSMYVLCSADYELPFANNSIDVLCYFGVLHHTRNRSINLKKDKKLLRENGYLILSESINRSKQLLSLSFSKAEISTHEHHISKEILLTQIAESGIEVVRCKEERTPFFTATMALFGKTMLRSKNLFLLFQLFDVTIAKTFGRIIAFLSAGEILLLARARQRTKQIDQSKSI